MDTNELIRQLTEERDRIDAAIKLLSGSDAPTKAPAKGKRKKMSAAARKRISAAQKARWAKAKKAK
jgi:hypothetical protein